MGKLVIDGHGRLSLPQGVVKELGTKALTLVSHSAEHLLLTARQAEGEVLLAGVLGPLPLADLLTFFSMFRKTGVLRLTLPAGHKELFFRQGEIVAATSTLAEESLGEILCAQGRLERKELRHLAAGSAATVELGDRLVASGRLSQEDLCLVGRQQVEAIIYHLFTQERGSFSFVASNLDGLRLLPLELNTQGLIMEGLRRIDERGVYLRRIGSMAMVPVATGKTVQGMPPHAERLLSLLTAERLSAREVLRKAGVGEFDGLRLLAHMVEKGLVRMEALPESVADGPLAEILSIFNGALGSLYRRIALVRPGFAEEVQVFLRDLPPPFGLAFQDLALGDDGTLEARRLLANLAGLDDGEQRRLLVEALTELIYMECSVARRELPTADSAVLIQRVQDITRRVKSLIGRNG